MIRQVLLFPLRVACTVTCVALILAAAPLLVLLDRRRTRDEAWPT